MSEIPTSKQGINRFEAFVHAGFEETLFRCGSTFDIEGPEFVQCVKSSALNYRTVIDNWTMFSDKLERAHLTGALYY